jgi:hypothetical protein
MDVYVLPVAADRYELYCEPEEDRTDGTPESSGWLANLLERFRVKLSRIDFHHVTESQTEIPGKWTARVRGRVMRWVAEKVAEQRLLWGLRRCSAARAFYPIDLPRSQAIVVLQGLLQRDAGRHRMWMIIDGLAFLFVAVVLGPIFLLIPGVANLPALYFGFRLFGHYLSFRGARRGLKSVAWTYEGCEPLSVLQQVLSLAADERERHVGEISSRLRLPNLPRFFRQTAD